MTRDLQLAKRIRGDRFWIWSFNSLIIAVLYFTHFWTLFSS
jgi:hypothetical protein